MNADEIFKMMQKQRKLQKNHMINVSQDQGFGKSYLSSRFHENPDYCLDFNNMYGKFINFKSEGLFKPEEKSLTDFQKQCLKRTFRDPKTRTHNEFDNFDFEEENNNKTKITLKKYFNLMESEEKKMFEENNFDEVKTYNSVNLEAAKAKVLEEKNSAEVQKAKRLYEFLIDEKESIERKIKLHTETLKECEEKLKVFEVKPKV